MNRRTLAGVTLLETVIAVALMTLIFLGFFGAYAVSATFVHTAAARTGALSLATGRMEYLRGLTYASLGTVGGTPSGTLKSTDTMTLNGVNYTVRTVITNVDDSANGAGGVDYKGIKVEVDWLLRTATQTVSLITYVAP